MDAKLYLYVVTFDGRPIAAPPHCQIGMGGGSIGSARGNTLLLPEDDLSVSAVQASIFWEREQFVLHNCGHGGAEVAVWRDATRLLVELGCSLALRHGDALEIGAWRIQATVIASVRISRELAYIDEIEQQMVGGPSLDDVRLGAAAPNAVAVGDPFIVHFTAYPANQGEATDRLLAVQDPRASRFLGRRSCRWRSGTSVTVSLLHPGFICDDAQQQFTWNGAIEVLDYVLRASGETSPGRRPVTMRVSIEGIVVASISVMIEVAMAPPPAAAEVRAETVAARTAFASYASADRGVVAHMVGAIERSAGIKVVTDYLHLLAGDRWQSALHRHIDQADLFLLFWSDEARRSSWVDWEWRTALRDKGEAAIQLHPLEPDVPAPPELAHLHFGSAHALVADYHRKRAHDEAQRQAAEARQAETRRAIERARLEGRPLDVLRALARLTRQWAGPSDASVAAAASIGDWFARFPISLAIAAIMEANERAYAWPVAPTLGAFCLSLDERLGQPELLVDGEQADIRAIWQARCSSHHDLLDYLSHCLRSCTEGDWHYAAPPREQRVPPSF